MNGISPENFSFKDYSARVFEKEGIYYRAILPEYQAEYDHLMTSGLYVELVQSELLNTHQEVEVSTEHQAYKILLPQQIDFLSLPFEWCYSQWRKVILAYIDINLIALKYGMILKDATPYNFCLKGGKAILFDTSSFAFFKEPNYWIAYRQFCEEMFGPFALMHYRGMRWGRLTLASHQGLPLDFISQNLPLKSRLNLNCLLHLHLHARSYHQAGLQKDHSKGFTQEKLIEIFSLIKGTVHKWDTYHQYPNYWSEYYDIDIETEEYLIDKQETIKAYLQSCGVQSILDLGANTGKFSELACDYASHVIALEFDKNCVDQIEKRIEETGNIKLHTLLGDLSQTSPDFGLLGKEHSSIFKRAKSDLVLALALVHHLALTKMIPFELIADLVYEFSNRYVLLEFIEKTDRKVHQLLQNNPRYYPSKEEFEVIIQRKFNLIQQKTLDRSVRTLYLLEKCG
jgi:SAM-dependent methyltransferase